MDERAKRRLVLRVAEELRKLAATNLDDEDVDFADERLVHDVLRSIHNGIIYVNGQRSVLRSLDRWEAKKRGE